MGARAEDKYVPQFSGECITITATTNSTTTSSFARTNTRTTRNLEFSGVTTSEDHYLTNYYNLV